MTDALLLPAEELLRNFKPSGVTLKTLVQAVLECAPVDEQGESSCWAGGASQQVGHLVRQRVRSPKWKEQLPVPGLNIMATVVADRAAHHAMYMRGAPGDALCMSDVQVEEVFKACGEFLRPHMRTEVESLFRDVPGSDGFFHSFPGGGPERIEQCLREHHGAQRLALTRVLDLPFVGHRLVAWRQVLDAVAMAGERLVDTTAVLLDFDNTLLAQVELRQVRLAAGTRAKDLVYVLDAYDEAGLELGAALRDAVCNGLLAQERLLEGTTVLQLRHFEVRQDLRGHGLGMRLLKEVLPAAVQGLRPQPQVFALALRPLQFAFPLRGYPAALHLEALDAVAALQGHFEAHLPHHSVRSLRHTPILYLGVDERATASHFEQLMLLADDQAGG